MSNTLAFSPEQFIFAQGEDLKTTSLKVAERFGKRHDHILRDIDKVLTQVSENFGKLNFEETEYEKNNNLNLAVKHRAFNLTKDGFIFLVMGFTGKDAAAIKEWYITAFNQMHAKLFPKTQYGLKSLPTLPAPRAKTYIKGGLELHQQDEINDMIALRMETVPKDLKAKTKIGIYSAILTKFEVPKNTKGGYKTIDPRHFENITQLIARLPVEDGLVTITREEYEAMKALPAPEAKTGEVMPNPTNTITVDLNLPQGLKQIQFMFNTQGVAYGRWAMWQSDGVFTRHSAPHQLINTLNCEYPLRTLETGIERGLTLQQLQLGSFRPHSGYG